MSVFLFSDDRPEGRFLLYTVHMTWALRRRLLILFIITVVVAGIVGGTAYVTVYQPPSCIDNKQNQDEEGIDCGGVCTYLCSSSQAAPSARFVRTITPLPGRTDVIAYIDNPNPTSAVRNLPFSIELYGPTNAVVAKKDGKLDLPPASTVPVYVPEFYTGSETVTRAFITFDTPQHAWFRYVDDRIIPKVTDITIAPNDTPRITATAVNPTPTTLRNIAFVVTVFDENGNAIAASRTIAPVLPPLGKTPLTFTWAQAFTGTVSRIEVIPLVAMPASASPGQTP